ERIARAAAVIDPVFLDSPQYRAESLEARLGCRLVVKVETLNPIRSFKGRGAEHLMESLEGRPHLVCATAGNFGQGMAYAARKRDVPLTIFTSAAANPLKIERMRALAPDIRLVEGDVDDAYEAARAPPERPPWSSPGGPERSGRRSGPIRSRTGSRFASRSRSRSPTC